VTTKARRPTTPSGLRIAGRALWASLTGRYNLRADELRILEVAARTADELAAIDKVLADAPAMVSGPRGREVPHPLLEEARRHRATFLRALGALGISAAEDRASREPGERSRAGRALVSARWDRYD
jgi:hypothetical protein